MGKQRRQRKKLHSPGTTTPSNNTKDTSDNQMDTSQPLLLQPPDNLFAGININLDSLRKDLDDTRSVKSFKSAKSEASGGGILPKKDKLRLRREVLMNKINLFGQVKAEKKKRQKRKNVSIIGDTNPLHDALPALESLLVDKNKLKKKDPDVVVKKGIEKASKRKRQLVQGVEVIKKVMNNEDYKKNPLEMISQRIQKLVNASTANSKIKM